MRFLRLIAEAFAAEIERQTLERERARLLAELELTHYARVVAMRPQSPKEMN